MQALDDLDRALARHNIPADAGSGIVPAAGGAAGAATISARTPRVRHTPGACLWCSKSPRRDERPGTRAYARRMAAPADVDAYLATQPDDSLGLLGGTATSGYRWTYMFGPNYRITEYASPSLLRDPFPPRK